MYNSEIATALSAPRRIDVLAETERDDSLKGEILLAIGLLSLIPFVFEIVAVAVTVGKRVSRWHTNSR
jgi:hypothetical protein